MSKPIRAEDLFAAVEAHPKLRLDPQVAAKSPDDEPSPSVPTPLQVEATPSTGPQFDLDRALSSVGGDTSLLGELIEIFLDECPRYAAQIDDAIRREDTDAVRRVAHSLKNSLGYFAHESIAAATAEIQDLAPEAPIEELAARWHQVSLRLSELRRELTQFLETKPPIERAS